MSFIDKKKLKNIEYILPIIVLCISLFGIFCILMATASPFTGEELTFEEIMGNLNLSKVKMQLIWLGIGFICMLAVMLVSYRFYAKVWYAVLAVSVGLLVMVILFGSVRGGTKGWIVISESRNITFQPSEIVKLAVVILSAHFLSRRPLKKFTDLLPALGVFALVIAVLLYQMDIGTTLVYVVIFAGMLFVSGVKLRYLGILSLGAVGAFLILWFFAMGDQQKSRILNFGNAEDVAQLKYSMIAIGSGGPFGKGLFSVGNMSQLSYIPAIETDFIFAVIGESLGFFGCLSVILLYMALIFRLWQLMHNSRDKYGKLIIAGIMFMYMFHIFENIGMTIGVMPITGIPLPFISYGGTNFVTNMIGIGLVMSVCYYRPEQALAAQDDIEI